MGLLAPGAVIAGYRIESVIGRGGMGVVYRACELELERDVALKVIAPELLEDADIRSRFLREVRAAASVEHPNVVPVHAAGERNGVAFLAMRLIAGEDLKRLVIREGPLPPGRAVEIVRRAAAGLDAIHRAGYVHRDVKPANVLVDRDGHVYVTDFGLARQVLDSVGPTGPGHWVGTLDYVAPEQIRGERVDARADVYALGGVLAFVLTGRVPFEREGDEAKLWAQLSEPPPAPSRLRPGLPSELDAVVARAMAKAADDRYPSAGDVGRAARAALSGGQPSQPERVVARGAAAPGGEAADRGLGEEASTVSAGAPTEVAPTRRPRRRRIAGGLGVLALAAGIAVVLAVTGGDPPPGTATVRVAETIRNVGHRPNGVAIAGGDLWVTSFDQLDVDRVDGATRHVMADHPRVGLGASAILASGTNLWVAAKLARRVVEIDARTGRVTRTLRPVGAPTRLAVGLGSLWVATAADPPGADLLIRYDESGNELESWPMPHGVGGLATAAGAVWIAERETPTVRRFDPETGRAVLWARKMLGPARDLYYGGGFLWATLESAGSIVSIDPRTRGRAPTTAAGNRPEQAIVAGGRLFVTSNTDHRVLLLDPKTLRSAGEPLDVDHNPFALAADDRSVWVTGLAEDTLTRIAYR